MFSRTGKYSVGVAINTAIQYLLDSKVNFKETTTAIGLPKSNTSKRLQKLSRKTELNADKSPPSV